MPPASSSPVSGSTISSPSGQASGAEGDRPGTGCVDSTEILRGQKTMEISHNGLTYRLQATRLGKLILTK